MRKALSVFLILAGIPAYATSVGVVAFGDDASYNDPGGLLPFSPPIPGTPFTLPLTLTFTYDTETADVDGDPGVGMYPGAISAISLTAGDLVIPSWPDTLMVMLDNYAPPQTDLWLAYTHVETPLTIERFGLQLVSIRGTGLYSDSIVPPSWPDPDDYVSNDPWTAGAIYYEILERATLNDPWILVASVSVTPKTITVVPLPGAVWLLGTGCLGLMGMRWRKAAA